MVYGFGLRELYPGARREAAARASAEADRYFAQAEAMRAQKARIAEEAADCIVLRRCGWRPDSWETADGDVLAMDGVLRPAPGESTRAWEPAKVGEFPQIAGQRGVFETWFYATPEWVNWAQDRQTQFGPTLAAALAAADKVYPLLRPQIVRGVWALAGPTPAQQANLAAYTALWLEWCGTMPSMVARTGSTPERLTTALDRTARWLALQGVLPATAREVASHSLHPELFRADGPITRADDQMDLWAGCGLGPPPTTLATLREWEAEAIRTRA